MSRPDLPAATSGGVVPRPTPDLPGRLAATLAAGRFAVTAETTPPDAADPGAVLARTACLKGLVDAVNVTDGAGARVHMSALAAAAVMVRHGIEPVLQVTMRDRNRLALQGDLIGAAALGIPSALFLHGDDVAMGDQPTAAAVHDLDTTAMLTMARRLCEHGVLPSGRAVTPPPRLLLGAADTPFDPPPDWRPDRLAGKLDAGARFVQTQFCFDVAVLHRYMARLVDHGITQRAHVLVGIGPLASAKSARWMTRSLFGVSVPEAVIRRLDGARDPRREGQRICLELLQELQEVEGVAGAHLMAPGGEQAIAEVIAESGLGRA
jgi:methylenetetrahydrofolate reductase (NADPH)